MRRRTLCAQGQKFIIAFEDALVTYSSGMKRDDVLLHRSRVLPFQLRQSFLHHVEKHIDSQHQLTQLFRISLGGCSFNHCTECARQVVVESRGLEASLEAEAVA